MKFTTAALVAVISTVEAVKIDRTELKDHRDYDFQRDLRYHGKGKGSDKVDDVCLSACAATCALPDCIPLDATAAPTKGKGGKGSKGSKNKFGMSSKGKGSSSEAPVSFELTSYFLLHRQRTIALLSFVTSVPTCSHSSVAKLPALLLVPFPALLLAAFQANLPVSLLAPLRVYLPVAYPLRSPPILGANSSITTLCTTM